MRWKQHALIVLLLLLVAGALVAARPVRLAQAATATPAVPVEVATLPVATPTGTGNPGEAAPCVPLQQSAWRLSPHADAEAEAFVHWDEDDPPVIPVNCARCHSTAGYLDFLGEDGTRVGVVDNPAQVGEVIVCSACHNQAAMAMTSVVFPSGAELTGLGSSARCMQCHQGRASTVQVDEALAKLGSSVEEDTPSEDISFINIHYYAAAATQYGAQVQGGYQYPEKAYQPKFQHVAGLDSCADCHDPHSLQVRIERCAECHNGVASTDDLRDIRMQDSLVDYDGDGDIQEGVYYELAGLQELLLSTMQAYAGQISGAPLAYSPTTHPYFFVDTNQNGQVDGDEAQRANLYAAFTPRLLKAAYNYQVSVKDPGAFAHNAKYIIELLYDSIASLNEALAAPVDLSLVHRDDVGHFNAIVEAFRHWDAEASGEVPAGCAKCHTATGLPFTLKHGVIISMPPSESLECITCHQSLEDFALHQAGEVTFPSGAVIGFGEDAPSNLCLNCHQGRESTVSVNAAISRAGVGPDVVSDELRFVNPHYFAAGATLFGSQAQGAYQYDGKDYNGRFTHVARYDTCAECHDPHSVSINLEGCSACHANLKTIEDLRLCRLGTGEDYDGDGNANEGVCGEIRTIHDQLLAAIQAYASETIGMPIAYAEAAYPYWYVDTNGNGQVDPGEARRDNGYGQWTPRLLRAAYNYQYVAKDPGAFAHNYVYILQVLYDSLEDIGGADAVAGMTRPKTVSAG
ncbi:MAG: hypothetical protein HPY83_06720 [Anaerolineae bacterium]|nr:hypothetical protein [Anaerolineae bacterium]